MTAEPQAENPHQCLHARPDNALKQTVGATVFFKANTGIPRSQQPPAA
jgi:hypothetical protein